MSIDLSQDLLAAEKVYAEAYARWHKANEARILVEREHATAMREAWSREDSARAAYREALQHVSKLRVQADESNRQ